MGQVRSWAGLDVHAAKVVAVSVDSETGEMPTRRLSGRTGDVIEFCSSLPGPTRVAYEPGPTGFTLARALKAAGVGCVIAAPGKIERPAQDCVKTDRRDAERLVRLLMIGGLSPVRAATRKRSGILFGRAYVRGDLMRARHRVGKMLLRHEIAFAGPGGRWSVAHRGWLGGLELPDRGAQITLLDYLGAVDALVVRRDALEAAIGELVPNSPWAETVARLRCFDQLNPRRFARRASPAPRQGIRGCLRARRAPCWSVAARPAR